MLELHYSSLLNYLRRRLRCPEMASDLAQEAIARVLAAEQNHTIDNEKAFLFRTAENLCIDYYRKAETNAQANTMNIDDFELPAPVERYSPDDLCDRNQSVDYLNRIISELPVKCREIFILHKFEGHSHAEIAKQYGITKNSVEKHIIRAMLYLKNRMNSCRE